MNDITIPFYFLEENHIALSAKEVDYAIRYELIYLKDLGKIVDMSLVKYPNDDSLLELALDLLLDNFYINTDVSNDVELESDLVSNKWRYILLLWLFENNADCDKVNEVYADFNYPPDMESFINYMPTRAHYDKLGHQGILNNWKVYLNTYKYLIES